MKSENDYHDCLVIIPSFDEARNIQGVLAGISQHLPGCVLLVVDDGSKDETGNIARKNGARVIRHPFNMGYGVALQTGYKYASRHEFSVILQIDADGQHDPQYLPQMVDMIRSQKVDVVIGSRFHTDCEYQAPFFRRLGMNVFNAIVSVLTSQKVTDSTSGYQALNPLVLRFYTSDLYPWDYPDADVLLMLHYANIRYQEIPVRMFPSADGKSMHSGVLKPTYYVLKMFLSILITVLRGRRIAKQVSGVRS